MMSLFGLGKKKEETQSSCGCGCGCGCKAPEGSAVSGPVTSIRVLGSGCKNCHTLLENTQEAVQSLGLSLQVEYVTDMQEIMASGAMSMPALEINGAIASSGRVLKAGQVAALLEERGR